MAATATETRHQRPFDPDDKTLPDTLDCTQLTLEVPVVKIETTACFADGKLSWDDFTAPDSLLSSSLAMLAAGGNAGRAGAVVKHYRQAVTRLIEVANSGALTGRLPVNQVVHLWARHTHEWFSLVQASRRAWSDWRGFDGWPIHADSQITAAMLMPAGIDASWSNEGVHQGDTAFGLSALGISPWQYPPLSAGRVLCLSDRLLSDGLADAPGAPTPVGASDAVTGAAAALAQCLRSRLLDEDTPTAASLRRIVTGADGRLARRALASVVAASVRWGCPDASPGERLRLAICTGATRAGRGGAAADWREARIRRHGYGSCPVCVPVGRHLADADGDDQEAAEMRALGESLLSVA